MAPVAQRAERIATLKLRTPMPSADPERGSVFCEQHAKSKEAARAELCIAGIHERQGSLYERQGGL